MCIATQQQPAGAADDLFLNMSCEPTKVTVSQHTEATLSMDESSASLDNSVSQSSAIHDPSSPDPIIVTGASSCVEDYYRVLPKVIGSGHYGVVRKCIDRRTRQRFAIKSIDKSKVDNFDMLKREISILREVDDHPGIVKMHDVHEDEKFLHIITELCEGGELFDRISEKYQDGKPLYSEQEAAKLLQSMLEAVDYCHQKNIAHRDIKPENFIFENTDEDSPIKLIDFGLARRHNSSVDAPLSDLVGTPYYMAPEVLDRCHTGSCDLWSIGVVAYVLLCGYPPFYGTDEEIFAMIRRGAFNMTSQPWDQISDLAKDFVCSLLSQDANGRWTARRAMKHPWMRQQLQPKKRRSYAIQMDEDECPESPRKKFKEDAILFDYEVSKSDVESIRCILTTGFGAEQTSGDNYSARVQPRAVVTPTVE